MCKWPGGVLATSVFEMKVAYFAVSTAAGAVRLPAVGVVTWASMRGYCFCRHTGYFLGNGYKDD